MIKILMIDLHNSVRKIITAYRPFVGETIRDAGYEFVVDKIILITEKDMIEVYVSPNMSLDKNDLIYYGWLRY